MTSPFPSLSALLSEPDVARLMAEPGPWWLWTADASRLVVANTTGARAMGAGGLTAALDRDYSTNHAFAGQIERLAPNLPADGTPRSERLRIAGRFGSESVTAEAFRVRAGAHSLIAVRVPALRRGTAREAVAGLVSSLRVPALAFDRSGRPLAASASAAALSATPLHDLVGPASTTLFDSLAADGRAAVDLVNGPMSVLALAEGEVLVALPAPVETPPLETGLRLVAGAETPVIEPPAAERPQDDAVLPQDGPVFPKPDLVEPDVVEPDAVAPVASETDGPEPEIRQDGDQDVTPEAPADAGPATMASARSDEATGPMESLPAETAESEAAVPNPAEDVEAKADQPPEAVPAAESGPGPVVQAEPDTGDEDLAPPQRFSWRMDADYRFHSIAPDEVAAPAGETFATAVERFGLDPQGHFNTAVTAFRPFSGVTALWPLGRGRRRLAVTLAAFPTLRDGIFQGYAGFGLVVEEAAPAEVVELAGETAAKPAHASTETPPDEVAPVPMVTDSDPSDVPAEAAATGPAATADPGPPAEPSTAGDVTPAGAILVEASSDVHDIAADAPVAERGIDVQESGFVRTEMEEPVAVHVPDEPAITAPDDTLRDGPAETEEPVAVHVPDEPAIAAPDDTLQDGPAETAEATVAGGSSAPAAPPDTGETTKIAGEAAETDTEASRPAAEPRPFLTVHTNPPNVVALRTSVGQEIKRPQLSPGERNAFREIARALGARTSDAAPDAGAPRPPEPLPPPAEQMKAPASPIPPDEAPAPHAPSPPVAPIAAPEPERTTAVGGQGDPAATGFIASGTPFGPLPSAFGTETDGMPGEDLAGLLDKVPTGLVVHRGNAILFANRTLLDWIGFADAAALEDAGGVSRLFAGATEESGEAVTLTTAEGTEVPVEARLSRVTWAGQPAFLFTLTRTSVVDAAADQESATLSELRGRLDEVEQILDTATDGIVIVTADGAIESMNRSAEALFGYESAEVKGLSVTTLFAPESHRSALDYCDGLLSNGVASVLNDGRQIIGRVKQGGLIPLYMTMGRTGPAARPKLAAVFRDMTNWKKAEEDLIAAKRQAEQASSQKSDFLAKISHEIRTPLNAIIGFSEVMMEERFGPVGNERYRDYLKDIHASGGHVLSLINDLLDLSKIEAGKLELAFTSVDLNDMVQSTVAIMQPQANRERVIIRSSLQPRLPNVVADSRSLRQIVLNLLSNSVKFTPAGGQIIVSTGLSDAGEAVLRVRDTGVGMTETELKAAMEPFRQVLTSNPRAAKGTGLGLPLTKALVEANRASFGISSTPNQGTLVEVVFPPTRVLAE